MMAANIPLRDLRSAWPVLWPMLEPAVRLAPDKPDVLGRLLSEHAQLWAIVEDGAPVAAVVTEITLLPEKRCRIWIVGGSRVREWMGDFMVKVEAFARAWGCVGLWAAGREGWARIAEALGFVRTGNDGDFPVWERRF